MGTVYVHVYPSGFIFCVGIPALVILDKDGKTINASGRAAISADPEGKVQYTSKKTFQTVPFKHR